MGPRAAEGLRSSEQGSLGVNERRWSGRQVDDEDRTWSPMGMVHAASYKRSDENGIRHCFATPKVQESRGYRSTGSHQAHYVCNPVQYNYGEPLC